MDIPGLSMNMSQMNLMNNVGAALLSKTLSTAEDIGTEMVKMMEQSVTPELGQNIDITL